MKQQFKYFTLFLILALYAEIGLAETKIKGFASFVGGLLTHGNQFLADYPNTGLYDDALSFSPDSNIGVQLKTKLDPQYEFIVQILSRGANEFQSDIDWAYINYSYNSEISLQVGRKRLPLYYYSDFYDLGFAYHWIRPPSDNYTWQISNFNGFSLSYEPASFELDSLFTLYIGREDDNENKLLSFLAGNTRVDESWKNILGSVAEISNDFLEFRLSFMTSDLYRKVGTLSLSEGVKQTFYGLSLNIDLDQYNILSEFNRYERPTDNIFVSTYMLSLTYRVKNYTPHITYSELNQTSGGDEYHYTYSIGLRTELNKSTAFKIQYDNTTENATTVPVVGDGELLSLGIDLVF